MDGTRCVINNAKTNLFLRRTQQLLQRKAPAFDHITIVLSVIITRSSVFIC